MTFVKICGLTTREDVDAALDAGADAIGLICAEKSSRFVDAAAAVALAEHVLERGRTPVFVVVDRAPALDALAAGAARGAWVQLHGGESPNEARRLRDATGAPIVKALAVRAADDLVTASDFDAADRLLLDAAAPTGAAVPGGHGRPFDWTMLRGWNAPKPWILSGGLTPETVADAIAQTGAQAVDIATGVERAPGVKDHAKVRAFIAAAKAARPNDRNANGHPGAAA